MNERPGEVFRNKVRLRVCGYLVENEKVLLVCHRGLGPDGVFWNPPGGGLEFGETVEEALKREFREETGLEVEPGPFLFFHEHIDERFHALELFFEVKRIRGEARLGSDPEVSGNSVMMIDLAWFSRKDLDQLPPDRLHSTVRKVLA